MWVLCDPLAIGAVIDVFAVHALRQTSGNATFSVSGLEYEYPGENQ
tara:strand:+ start:268 stop:405 length:138 start_codon:yes stop_codon:yes gene_type:complete